MALATAGGVLGGTTEGFAAAFAAGLDPMIEGFAGAALVGAALVGAALVGAALVGAALVGTGAGLAATGAVAWPILFSADVSCDIPMPNGFACLTGPLGGAPAAIACCLS